MDPSWTLKITWRFQCFFFTRGCERAPAFKLSFCSSIIWKTNTLCNVYNTPFFVCAYCILYVSIHMWVLMCTGEHRGQMQMSRVFCSLLFFEAVSLIDTGSHWLARTNWPSSSRSFCSLLPSARITGLCYHSQLCLCFWGSEFKFHAAAASTVLTTPPFQLPPFGNISGCRPHLCILTFLAETVSQPT